MVGEKIKVLNRQIVEANAALLRIGHVPMQARTAYWMGRNFDQINPVAKKLEKERGEIIKKYGVKNEDTGAFNLPMTVDHATEKGADGKPKQIPNPNVEKAGEEFEAILDQEVEVEIMKVNIDGFQGTVGLGDMQALGFLIAEDVSSNVIQLPPGGRILR